MYPCYQIAEFGLCAVCSCWHIILGCLSVTFPYPVTYKFLRHFYLCPIEIYDVIPVCCYCLKFHCLVLNICLLLSADVLRPALRMIRHSITSSQAVSASFIFSSVASKQCGAPCVLIITLVSKFCFLFRFPVSHLMCLVVKCFKVVL